MYYRVVGKGPPILLIHGGLSDQHVWDAQLPILARHHSVIVADSRGQGRSTRTDEPITYRLMADDYVALLDYLHIDKVDLVGWSDGGIIGLDIHALSRPAEQSFRTGCQCLACGQCGLYRGARGRKTAAGASPLREYRA
ncbi:alpha/beta fold hydrolase [Brucella abortus]|uniref:alpha/beta fold hydrolase n=1 Tax=Brucella abortus TaxID=235 RepID=UPI003CD0DC1F